MIKIEAAQRLTAAEPFTPNSAQLKQLQVVANRVLKGFGKKPNDWLGGLCTAVTVTLWDVIGSPKSLVPYSVFVGEEEHVILYDKAGDYAIDPTASQFNMDFYLPMPKDRSTRKYYKSFRRLNRQELEGAREEATEYKKNKGLK